MASSGGKSRSVAGRALPGAATASASAGDTGGSTVTTATETASAPHDVHAADGFTGPVDAGGDGFMETSAAAAATGTGGATASETVTGTHVLRIDGFSGTKELGVGAYVESGAFRVGGHAWQVVCYPCGDEAESAGWVSLFLHLGDAAAGDRVTAECAFTLMDFAGAGGAEPAQSIRIMAHVFSAADRSRGCDFVRRTELETEPSPLKDDCLRVRCDVVIVHGEKFPPPPELHRHLGELLASQVGKDVTFEVGGEAFTAHRCVLAARSSVFMAELFGPEEDKDAVARHVEISNMEPEVFKALLHFVYTDSLPQISSNDGDKIKMVQGLLVAANRYDMKRMKVICEDIPHNSIDASKAATTLLLAEKNGCHRLKVACLAFLKNLLASVEVPADRTCSMSS